MIKTNLFNFINDISERLSLENIPDFMKDSFNLEEIKIFEENSYLKKSLNRIPKFILQIFKIHIDKNIFN